MAIPIPSDEPYEYWDSQNKHGKGILLLKHSVQLSRIGVTFVERYIHLQKYSYIFEY